MISLEDVRRRAEIDARTHGYYLNPDEEFLKDLLEGLKKNEERYGYPSCPCRVGTGNFEMDRDIICPCDYRDPDIEEFGACYCSLYVDREVHEESKRIPPIPERRPMKKQTRSLEVSAGIETTTASVEEEEKVVLEESGRSVYYCRQCGYMAFRDEPPYICPICRAPRERFSEVKPRLHLLSS
ncbi:MAG: ferredoxin-thioredoxin reductase catalytic domain-containing protein [Candidatus Bathyarchaeia archaeon]